LARSADFFTVTDTLQRRCLVLIAAAVIAIFCWKIIPGTIVDRVVFTGIAHIFENPPFYISGNSSHASPWKLQSEAEKSDSLQPPVIVSLGDDLEGFFQSSPASPIDLAVILSNFQRLGVKKAATAAVLAWDAPDPIGLAALDKAIGGFESVVMAAPLSRGAVPEPMQPAFRRASIAIDIIHGDTALLPVVNRIPLPGIIFGGENTLAGFQALESEPDAEFVQLIARWNDRAVFAFPLLAALQQLDLTVDGVEIQMGKSIRLGPLGPIIPMDSYGRMALPLEPASPLPIIPAETLIDRIEPLLSSQAIEPVILRDDRSLAEAGTRRFSEQLPAVMVTITSAAALSPARDYPRIPIYLELMSLFVLVLLLAAICTLPASPRNLACLIIATNCLVVQAVAAGYAHLWLPGIPALAATLSAFLFSYGKNIVTKFRALFLAPQSLNFQP
jgi:hypothetical protein